MYRNPDFAKTMEEVREEERRVLEEKELDMVDVSLKLDRGVIREARIRANEHGVTISAYLSMLITTARIIRRS